MRTRARALAAAAAIALGAAGCFSKRDRLDVPSVSFTATDTLLVEPGPGTTIDSATAVIGTFDARDGSGVTQVNVSARVGPDRWLASFGGADDDRVVQRFIISLDTTIAPGTAVVVTAEVFDNQDFVSTAVDTIFVHAPARRRR